MREKERNKERRKITQGRARQTRALTNKGERRRGEEWKIRGTGRGTRRMRRGRARRIDRHILGRD